MKPTTESLIANAAGELKHTRANLNSPQDAARCAELEATLHFLMAGKSHIQISDSKILAELTALSQGSAAALDDEDLIRIPAPFDDELDDKEFDSLWDALTEQILDKWHGDSPDAEVEVLRYLRVATVVCHRPLPRPIAQLLEEMRRTYAHGFYQSAVSLARTILEKAVTELAAERGLIAKPQNTAEYYKQYPPSRRLDALLGSTPHDLERATICYREASAVIHGQRSLGEKRALAILREVTFLLGILYSDNRI